MAKKAPGRPKATDPRDVKISLRLTAGEADLLQRLAKDGSPAAVLRKALGDYAARLYANAQLVPDTDKALVQRALRQAKRQATTDTAALEHLFSLGDEADEADEAP